MLDLIEIGNNQIEKHFKYKEQYKPFSVFWGLGIEEEVYFEFEYKKFITSYLSCKFNSFNFLASSIIFINIINFIIIT